MKIKSLFSTLAVCVIATTGVYADPVYETFDIHFTILTSNPSAQMVATLSQMEEEVNILNTYFVKEDRSPIIKFKFKSVSFYNDVKDSNCDFVSVVNSATPYNSDGWAALFNACNDPLVKDKNAINFYVYDGYSVANGFNEKDSHGKRNSNRPYVMLDWQRINHNIQSPEEHEMGHAFGLDHVCVPGATINSSTNIMASAGGCDGSGGKRDIGFNDSQVNTIMYYVPLIKAKLASP
ncbi:hypothetical protein EXE30_02150 [Acinetobacter halotolerans]|uniref:Metalloprotease n=1 Tax=Acinetobacter halotolerans TaxID=1752076 RepID=A0A4Q6XKL4_9GAMM|nr:hypothetical protein [Acinetobacter halotolerans]RZF55630.1 hypothetical protein EXE30_02150 [Acinetobacter halotolerans]